jgi:hypothetical protein
MKMRVCLLWLCCALITGCETNPAQSNATSTVAGANTAVVQTQNAYRKSLQEWVGKSVEQLTAQWGAAKRVDDLTTGGKTYAFDREPKEIDIQGEKLTITCLVRMRTNAKGTIKSFGFEGSTCLANDYSPGASVPIAYLTGTGQVEDAKTMRWFEVVEIFGAEQLASVCGDQKRSPGDAVSAQCVGNRIPAKPMQVKIRAIRSKGNSPADRASAEILAEGVVDLKPEAGHEYLVNGELTNEQSKVWIEDTFTRKPATSIVVRQR